MILKAGFHCRGVLQSLMDAAEVIVGEVERERGAVIFPFLTERIRQSGGEKGGSGLL